MLNNEVNTLYLEIQTDRLRRNRLNSGASFLERYKIDSQRQSMEQDIQAAETETNNDVTNEVQNLGSELRFRCTECDRRWLRARDCRSHIFSQHLHEGFTLHIKNYFHKRSNWCTSCKLMVTTNRKYHLHDVHDVLTKETSEMLYEQPRSEEQKRPEATVPDLEPTKPIPSPDFDGPLSSES